MLDADWHRWIAENKLLGAPDAEIYRVVEATLGTTAGVAAALDDVARAPVFRAAVQIADQLRKLQSLTRNLHAVQAVAPHATRIARRHNLSATDFFIDYYARNTPVIMTGLLDSWPAMTRWTPDYLKSVIGALDVEVMAGREGQADYESGSHKYKQRMSFGTYLDRALTVDSNDFYLVANNQFFKQPGTDILLQDFATLAGFQHPREQASHSNLWLGPKGTITPLHHDPSNILFMQIWGTKQFRFISPLQTPDIYNHLGVFSQIDPEQPDLARYPDFARCVVIEELISAGDVLFIPVGWWHHVRGLSPSLSLSSTSFVVPNQFSWHYPPAR